MPIYEYECRACGKRFEQLVRDTAVVPACPSCQSANIERILSLFAVSSEATMHSNLQKAKQKNKKVIRDKEMAQIEYEKAHEH